MPFHNKMLRWVYSFRVKNSPTDKTIKYVARFCADSSKKIEGINCTESHTPVAKLFSFRAVDVLSVICDFEAMFIDFDQAHNQDPIDIYACMYLFQSSIQMMT